MCTISITHLVCLDVLWGRGRMFKVMAEIKDKPKNISVPFEQPRSSEQPPTEQSSMLTCKSNGIRSPRNFKKYMHRYRTLPGKSRDRSPKPLQPSLRRGFQNVSSFSIPSRSKSSSLSPNQLLPSDYDRYLTRTDIFNP